MHWGTLSAQSSKGSEWGSRKSELGCRTQRRQRVSLACKISYVSLVYATHKQHTPQEAGRAQPCTRRRRPRPGYCRPCRLCVGFETKRRSVTTRTLVICRPNSTPRFSIASNLHSHTSRVAEVCAPIRSRLARNNSEDAKRPLIRPQTLQLPSVMTPRTGRWSTYTRTDTAIKASHPLSRGRT